MKADRTLVLDLRVEEADGGIGDGQLVYAPSDWQYAEVLAHIGGLSPGETKLVPPWPVDDDDDISDLLSDEYDDLASTSTQRRSR
jgi:hypothetical protein